MTRRHDATGRSKSASRYVAIAHWIMKTAAWRDLDCVARAAYLELASRYAGPGSNNGRIPYSLDEMKVALRIGKSTAGRAFKRLEDHGFIVCTFRGRFDKKLKHSSEWLLTEYGSDVTGELATTAFARWPNLKPGPVAAPIGSHSGTARVLQRD